MAHKIALENNQKTIGIIGSGLDKENFYPQENWNLQLEMIKANGLVISEYPPGMIPNRYNFPARNRLLACVSRVTLIAQAGLRSGSLITARLALEQGKEVATVPVSILERLSEGNNKLIKDGAHPIVSSNDLLDILKLPDQGLFEQSKDQEITKFKIKFDNDTQTKIYKNLDFDGIAVDNLSEKTELTISDLNKELTMLELNGLVKSIGENIWCRS